MSKPATSRAPTDAAAGAETATRSTRCRDARTIRVKMENRRADASHSYLQLPHSAAISRPVWLRSVAQPGSAHRSGRWGRRFKSCHSDQPNHWVRVRAPEHPTEIPTETLRHRQPYRDSYRHIGGMEVCRAAIRAIRFIPIARSPKSSQTGSRRVEPAALAADDSRHRGKRTPPSTTAGASPQGRY